MDMDMTPRADGGRADCSPLTPASMTSGPSQHLAFFETLEERAPASQGKYDRLSRFLNAALPSREDTERIRKASPHPAVPAHELMTMPYTTLVQNGAEKAESLLELPSPNLHPVLIARHMLLLASLLQHLHPDVHNEIKGLSEPPRAMSSRLADLAIDLVTTKDELLGNIEGLECIMIESVYQANLGNLRRSWVAGRKAVTIAQLMGLNRSDNRAQYEVLDPRRMKHHPQIMWSRIVFLDRFLCLMLGLPQGCTDRSMSSAAMLTTDLPMERLERIHCVVASRILERNGSDPSFHGLSLTRTLDLELQRAARSLPSKWWLMPKLDIGRTDSRAMFWNTGRLFAQVLHYNLLNQLHLPYMLRSSSAERKYEYSRITCVNASREVLTRFIALRSFNGIASSCRIVDFLALMAAITLLLAHLDAHIDSQLTGRENLLAHQYHSDRAMTEHVQENMIEVNRLNSDALSVHSADLLRRLLAIDVETTDSYPQYAGRVSVHEAGTETAPSDQDDETVVSVHIPYFGIIKIAREGVSMKRPESKSTPARTSRLAQAQVVDKINENGTHSPHAEPQMRPSGLAELVTLVDTGCRHVEAPAVISDAYAKTQAQTEPLSVPATGANDIATQFAPKAQNGLCDPLLQHGDYHGLAAGVEDWAFQGVDLAFFESLIRSAENEGNRSAEWTTAAEVDMNI